MKTTRRCDEKHEDGPQMQRESQMSPQMRREG